MPNTYKRRRTGLVNTDIVNAIGLPGVEAIKEDGTVDGTDPRTTEAVFFDGDASTLFWPADFFSVGTGNILRVTFKNPLRPNDAPTTVDVGTITVSTPTTLTGDRTFDSNVTVQGGTTTATLDVGTDATIGNTLTVTGLMTANGAVDLTGPLTLSGELVAEGSSTLQDITITTTAEIKGELNVLGTSTLGGNVTVSPGAVLTSDTIQVTNVKRVDPSDDTKRLVIDDHLDDVAVRALTDALDTRVTELEANPNTDTVYDDTALAGRVTVNEGDISALDTRVTNLDGGGTTDTTLADRVTVNEGDIEDNGTAIAALDNRVTALESRMAIVERDITDLKNDAATTPDYITASGGTVEDRTVDGVKVRIHTFDNVGSDAFTVTDLGSTNGQVNILVAGGGGGGGYGQPIFGAFISPYFAGGGGGGGQVILLNPTLSVGQYTMTIGDGGSAESSSAWTVKGGNGSSTTWNGPSSVTAAGGAGGGGSSTSGADGYNGGGGGANDEGGQSGGNGSGGENGEDGTSTGESWTSGDGGGVGTQFLSDTYGSGGKGKSDFFGSNSVRKIGGGGGNKGSGGEGGLGTAGGDGDTGCVIIYYEYSNQ